MLLITVMVVQQGSAVVISAEAVPETAAETSTEPATQAPPETQPPQTEPATQAPTEPPQTEPVTQAPTEPPQTEPVTQAPTEPATQAPTEPPQTEPTTQAPTEPPQTEPTTQAPTEPPQTEPTTQEPGTEQTEPTTQAPTEPPQTEPTTQEPGTEQTEPTTQEPGTEQTEPTTQAPTETERPQTEKPDETETEPGEPNPPAPPVPEFPTESETETETEAQTDVKDRQNNGTRIRVSVVRDGLIDVLPYLIVADKITGLESEDPDGAAAADLSEPESEQEEIRTEDVLSGSGASDVLDILEGFSLELANGRATRTVKVVNLYVDEDGGIDDQKLQEALAVKLPNVEDEMAVVNIIASSEDQALSFSGYDIFDTADAEKVLYNFAAFEYINENKIKFKDYTGTVTLSNGAGLEGTWLAPTAQVNIASPLSGAVYADTVNVSDGATLKKVELAGDSAEETELKEETQPEEEPDSEESTEETSETELFTEEGTEIISETELSTEEVTEESPETELLTEEGTEEISETELLTEEGTEEISETELLTEEGTEEISETELLTEEETEESSETELLTEEDSDVPETEEDTELELLDEGEALQADEVSGVGLTIHVLNGADGNNTPVAGVMMAIKAAEDITGSDGTVLYEKDAQVTSFASTAEGVPVGTNLTSSGYYYVEMTEEEDAVQTEAEYLPGTRVYFHVNKQGHVLIGENRVTELNYYVYQFEENEQGTVPGGLLIVEAPSGSTFVVKDKDDKEILKDSAGYPSCFITIPASSAGGESAEPPAGGTYPTGRAAVTLPAGTYWLSQITAPEGYVTAADQKFEIKTEEAGGVLLVVSNSPADAASANTLNLTVQTMYGNTLLTAETEMEFYAALFEDEALTKRVTGVQKITQRSGTTDSEGTVFYVQGTKHHYVAETDELGVPVTGYTKSVVDESGKELPNIKYAGESGETLTAVLRRDYSGAYPDGLFSYMADISITKNVQDKSGKEQAVTDEFYVSLFRDANHTELEQTVPIALENMSTRTVTVRKKMTAGEVSYYAAETDSSGVPAEKIGNGTYNYSGASLEGTDKEGRLAVICGEQPKLTVTNTLGDSIVKIRVADDSGKYLSGAELVFKNSERKVLKISGTIVFQSKGEDIVWTGVFPAGSYYLSEVKAPTGYMPAADVPFTVAAGMTTDAVLVNTPARGSGKVTAGVQIYEGTNQLYAQDTSSGQYAAAGSYTRYFALFLDGAYTQKATNVQSLTISGFTGTTTFENLEEGKTYYVAETDQYGQVRGSNTTRTISYTDNGRVTALSSDAQVIANENYSTLPQGFRYSARLTIEKRVLDSSDQAKAVSESFYVGIYRNADFSDTPTIVRLDLNNASSASVTRRILLSGTSDVTYYFAEVNANGQRIADSTDFNYTSSIDKEQVTLTKGADEKIVVTNKDRISKVTLYLTKRVYRGSTLQNVNATFYAGLFRDPEFTNLYTNPVALNIQNNSSVTLKLSLNLGAAAEATIYVAEVDRNGKVVQSGSSFGYDTRVINSTVHFTQETTEVQSIILNTVSGTATDDDWNDIYSSSENNVGGSSGSYSDYISENGSASSGTAGSGTGSGSSTNSVQTGDDTPWAAYLVLMMVSGAAVIAGGRRRRRIRK